MPRPRGFPLNPDAWADIVVQREGLTVTELAERIPHERSSVSAVLGGHTRASLSMAKAIAAAANARIGSLFPTVLAQFDEADLDAAIAAAVAAEEANGEAVA